MSVETWEKEFYPTVASGRKAKKAPVAHSIKKWEGLLPRNLAKHDVALQWGELYEKEDLNSSFPQAKFIFLGHNCALCEKYFKTSNHLVWDEPCKKCPLYIVRDGYACVERRPREKASPFDMMEATGNPKPMLRWLKKAQEAGYA